MLDLRSPGLATVKFKEGQEARLYNLSPQQTAAEALQAMGIEGPTPTLVIIGGASEMSAESLKQLQTIFNQVIAPLATDLDLTVLDGGTDAGVIHMMGTARHYTQGTFRLIGVAPQGKVRFPHEPADTGSQNDSRHPLEPHHTDFLLVPGDDWGCESPWLSNVASTLAGDQPTLAILVNGGKVAFTDLKFNLDVGRPTVVLSGSGRLADSISAFIKFRDYVIEPHIADVVNTYYPDRRLSLLDFASPLEELSQSLRAHFNSDYR